MRELDEWTTTKCFDGWRCILVVPGPKRFQGVQRDTPNNVAGAKMIWSESWPKRRSVASIVYFVSPSLAAAFNRNMRLVRHGRMVTQSYELVRWQTSRLDGATAIVILFHMIAI